MLTLFLLFLVAGFVLAGFFFGFATFLCKTFAIAAGILATMGFAPVLVPPLSKLLGVILPLVFVRILVVFGMFFIVYLLVQKLWNLLLKERLQGVPASETGVNARVGYSVVNGMLGAIVFFLLLLGYAGAVDLRFFSPIVSSEGYYQSIANGFSSTVFGRVPAHDYIVKVKPKKRARPAVAPMIPEEDRLTDYDNLPKQPARHQPDAMQPQPVSPRPQPSRVSRETTVARASVGNDEIKGVEPYQIPELNIKPEEVEALQEMVTDEVQTLLRENPDELKRALAEVLTEEKGNELSAAIDNHIKHNRPIGKLMQTIEQIMGDPNNLSEEFKEALPEIIQELEQAQ